MLIIKGNIREIAQGFNVSGDFADALNKRIEKIIMEACSRAESNGRKTVMAKDI